VLTPVGYKCRTCGLGKQVALLAPSVPRVLAAAIIALAGGALGGVVLGSIGFFGIWLAFIYGRFLGTLILKATRGNSGALMEIVTGVAVIAGGLAPRLLLAAQAVHMASRWSLGRLVTGAGPVLQPLLMAIDLYTLVIVVVIAATVVSRLRGSWSYRGM